MNIIFLDVDGVLNSLPYLESVKEYGEKKSLSIFHLEMLSKIYHQFDAKIVLASTWKNLDDENVPTCYQMYKYLIDSLSDYGMKIYSKTPYIRNHRPLEIVTWLDEQPNKEDINFIILDDDFSKNDYKLYGLDNNLIETSFFCKRIEDGGLQQRHVDKAIELFAKQLDKNNRLERITEYEDVWNDYGIWCNCWL